MEVDKDGGKHIWRGIWIEGEQWVEVSGYVLPTEEILDDGVGLYLESSGDSLDEDLHIYSDTDQYRKVRTVPALYV